MGGDPVPGPLSRFIPSIDEFLRARREASSEPDTSSWEEHRYYGTKAGSDKKA